MKAGVCRWCTVLVFLIFFAVEAEPVVDALKVLGQQLTNLSGILGAAQRTVPSSAGGSVAPTPFPVATPGTIDPLFPYKRFDDWYIACEKLPLYKDVEESRGKLKPYEARAKDFTFHVLNTEAKMLALTLQDRMNNPVAWLNQQQPSPQFFSQEQYTFWPYVEKVVVPLGSRVIFHGDLHGDIQSLLAMIVYWRNKGVMNQNNAFQISDPNTYFVFLGDSVDRGNYGAEVFYTLLRLKNQNPSNVFIVRGNHEALAQVLAYGFQDELETKFFSEITPSVQRQGLEKRAKTTDKKVDQFYQMFDLLPVALYLGCGIDSDMNFIQCNHGGLEPGYLPNKLLAAPSTVLFDWVQKLSRKTNLLYAIKPMLDTEENKRSEQQKSDLSAVIRFMQVADKVNMNLVDFIPDDPGDLGFLWNDFIVQPDITVEDGRRGQGIVSIGKDITRLLLEQASSSTRKVQGVFRAHQQSPSNEMTPQIIKDNGVARLWKPMAGTYVKKDVWPGMVFTFMAGPHSNVGYGSGNQTKFHDYFGVLTTAAKFEDWKFTVISQQIATWPLK